MKQYVSPSVTSSPLISLSSRPSATSEFASGFMQGFGFGLPRLSPEMQPSLEAFVE